MQVTLTNYHRLARSMGLLLALMGASMTTLFVVYTWTGENPLVHATPSIDGVGLLILASIGAFALPLGLSLFSADASTSARVKIAAYALGIMAVLRLAAFANPEMRAVVGVTPLYEFVVLGALGLIAFLVRPETEANIDVHMTIDVARSAREAWTVLGEQFGDVGLWATAVASSSLEGDVGVGAVRTCQIPGFGPIAAGIITEELTHYDAESMKFTYVPKEGVPRMIKRARNQWSIEALAHENARCEAPFTQAANTRQDCTQANAKFSINHDVRLWNEACIAQRVMNLTSRFAFASFIALSSLAFQTSAHAQDSLNETNASGNEVPWGDRHAFDRDFAGAAYGLGWTGPYEGYGGGLRLRWEPFDKLGVEVYSEHLRVDDPEGLRHDHPIGFNLYVPFRLTENFRVRPLFGFCSVFSFVHPSQTGAERIDDIQFGVHAGAGIEYALGRFVSLFFDAQVTSYFGHGRTHGGWSTHVGDNVDMWFIGAGALGVQVHL